MSAARRVVTAAVVIEALVVVGYGMYLGVEAIVTPTGHRLAALFLAAMTVLFGAGLALVARAVAQGRRGARAPVLVWQILQAAVAVPAAYGASDALLPAWVGIALLVLCLVAGLGVLRSDVVDADAISQG